MKLKTGDQEKKSVKLKCCFEKNNEIDMPLCRLTRKKRGEDIFLKLIS